jgi:phage portal protein BeeE
MDSPVDIAARGGKIKTMLTLEPGLFWHIVQGYELTGWRYTGSPLLTPLPSEILLPTEVLHHRTFNPYLYWRGMSPLIVATLAAMTDYAAAQFMKGLMMNNADTGVIVTTDQQASVEQREALNAALRERKRKAGTADRPLFLWGGMKLEKPALSSADMEFLANRKWNLQEIFGVFKVPPSMAGIETGSGGRASGTSGGSSSGGSQQQDRRVFIENTITTLCRQIEAAFAPIAKRFDPSFEVWFDIDSLPIMQEARRDRLTAATAAFGMGIPLNDINQVYDLGFKKFPHGDTAYLPFNLQPVQNDGEIGAPTGTDPNDPNNPEIGDGNEDPNEPKNCVAQSNRPRGKTFCIITRAKTIGWWGERPREPNPRL